MTNQEAFVTRAEKLNIFYSTCVSNMLTVACFIFSLIKFFILSADSSSGANYSKSAVAEASVKLCHVI